MKRRKYQRSFTLLESIVAIYVFLLGIVGAMTLANQALSSAALFKDQLTASNLAQEGEELVRNARDSDFLASLRDPVSPCVPDPFTPCDANNAFNPPNICDNANFGCYVDRALDASVPALSSATSFLRCNFPLASGKECKFLLKDATGFYQYTSGASTKFDRRIFITKVTIPPLGADTAGHTNWRVQSIVTWQQRFGTGTYKVETELTPWLQ